jgi:molecular chaperone GrpE
MFAPLIGKELAELVEDGTKYSLPVAVLRAGRQFDALFLYNPENGPAARPTGWLMLDSHTGKLALIAECDVMDFAAPDLFAPELSKTGHEKNLTPKKESQLRLKVNDYYDEIRRFVFTENLDRSQAAAVTSYKEAFLKLIPPGHYPFYYALSPHFFQWLRLPFPTHRAALNPEDKPVLEEPTQVLILQNLQNLVYRFENKIQTDEHKQGLFDDMHEELQEYKNDMIDRLTLSLERDVIKLHDDISKSVGVFSEKPASPDSYDKLFIMLEGFATDLEDLLYRHGVEPYEHGGNDVDVTRQKVLYTEPTDDPALDRKVAKRLARGWEKQGRIISPERISAYLFQKENDI